MAFLAENEHVDRGRSPKRLFQQRKQKNPAQTEAGSNVLILAHQQSKKYAVRPLCLLKADASLGCILIFLHGFLRNR